MRHNPYEPSSEGRNGSGKPGMMQYSVPCGCGVDLSVKATEAGTVKVCRCGRSVQIPLLSKLRVLAGREAYEISIVDTIARRVREQTLPEGTICAHSGVSCTESHRFYIECEKPWFKGGRTKASLLVDIVGFLFIPMYWLRLAMSEPVQETGRHTVVEAPLRVRTEHLRHISRMSQKELRNLLSQVDDYRQLLEKYPEATIHPPR
jgi:hypothetical protein